MFDSIQPRRNHASAMAVDIAPLIDVVFILLIFFLVTTTFVRDTGIEVERPEAAYAEALESTAMRISIAPSGAVYTEGRAVTLDELRQSVRAFLAAEPNGAVVVIPDRQLPAGRLIEVMDTAKGAGARDIAVATEQRSER